MSSGTSPQDDDDNMLWDAAIEIGAVGKRYDGLVRIASVASICCGLLLFAGYRLIQAGSLTTSFSGFNELTSDAALQLATSIQDVEQAIGAPWLPVPARSPRLRKRKQANNKLSPETYMLEPSEILQLTNRPLLDPHSALDMRLRQPMLDRPTGRWLQPPPANLSMFRSLNATSRAALVRSSARSTQLADFMLVLAYTATHVLVATLLG